MRGMISAFEDAGHDVEKCIIGEIERVQKSYSDQKYDSELNRNGVKNLIPGFLWEYAKDVRLTQRDHSFVKKLSEAVERSSETERSFYIKGTFRF